EDTACSGKRPIEHCPGIGASANNAAVPAAEGFEIRRGVDVSYGYYVVYVDHFSQVTPCLFHGTKISHVGHAATGGEVGQVDLDDVAREDVGGLGHEMNAAKHNGAAGGVHGG